MRAILFLVLVLLACADSSRNKNNNSCPDCNQAVAHCELANICSDTSALLVAETGADATSGMVTFAVDAAAHMVYWSHWGTRDVLGNNNFDGSVWRWDLSGQPVLVVALQECAASLTIDDSYLYWTVCDVTDESQMSIRRMPKDGATFETLVDHQQWAGDLQVDSTHVFWSDTGGIHRVQKDGTGLDNLPGPNGSFYVGAEQVYYFANDAIQSIAKDGSGSPQMLSGYFITFGGFLGLVNETLYIADGGPPVYTVWAISTMTGAKKMVVNQETASDPNDVNSWRYQALALALDSEAIYWLRRPVNAPVADQPSELYVAPSTVGLPQKVGEFSTSVLGVRSALVVVDDTLLLWSANDDIGKIFALPKPVYAP